jgi:DNA-directed RNA polymerase specialized sigma subunit
MKLMLDDLKEYAAMSVTERHTDRGREIRKELDERMRWMPIRWRRVIRCRYIMNMSVRRTSIEISASESAVKKWTRQIAEWLEDKDKYLDELT